ncbi:MAG: hypothetical protein ABSF21_00890 [Dehalococcoidia bacterium]
MANFKFAQQDLDKMVIDALQQQPVQGGGQGGVPKPTAMQKLLAQAQLNKGNPPPQGMGQ